MTIEELRNNQYESGFGFIKSVEINPIELCNRGCFFCPRSDKNGYPTTGKSISIETCKNIAIGLKSIGYKNRVGFVGFGEPLLHKNLEECILEIKRLIPDMEWIEINTNGDFLSTSRIQSLKDSGCNIISVSMYDSDISDKIMDMNKCDMEFVFRHHYEQNKNFGLKIVDRKNIAFGQMDYNIKSPCYIPFYKLFIDWNGDVITCQNDWFRHQKFGNVNESNISEILGSEKMIHFKKMLINGDRSVISPCKKCNVDGTIRGKEQFDEFKRSL